MNKNYIKDMEPYKRPGGKKPTWKDYVEAFIAYLHKPKTVFDFKDRTVFLAMAILLILLLQWLVE